MRGAGMNPFLQFLYRKGHRLKSAALASGIPLNTLAAISGGTRRLTPDIRSKLAVALGCSERAIPDPQAAVRSGGGASLDHARE